VSGDQGLVRAGKLSQDQSVYGVQGRAGLSGNQEYKPCTAGLVEAVGHTCMPHTAAGGAEPLPATAASSHCAAASSTSPPGCQPSCRNTLCGSGARDAEERWANSVREPSCNPACRWQQLPFSRSPKTPRLQTRCIVRHLHVRVQVLAALAAPEQLRAHARGLRQRRLAARRIVRRDRLARPAREDPASPAS
jgi:hypothetical protein